MRDIDLLTIRLTDKFQIAITVGWLFFAIALVIVVLAVVIRRRLYGKKWETVEVNIALANIGKVCIRPNHEVARIAHQAWAEIVTRSAGLHFNEKDDVIVEVYNSWHQLFGELRDLAKSAPAEKLRESPDARKLISILVRTLNEGLRPHLTHWQARFRRWYGEQLQAPENASRTPQEIQQDYPEYEHLVEGLKTVNAQMMQFANELQKIAQG